jgi:hypothetical protein
VSAPASPGAPPGLVTILLVAAVAVLLQGWAFRDAFVDDAFIGFRYVQNVVAGRGFVFNPGEPPIEGVTNIGWLLLLVPASHFAAPHLVGKAIGVAMTVASLALLAAMIRALAAGDAPLRHRAIFALPIVLAALCFEATYFSAAGMETGLLAALLLAMTLLAGRARASLALGGLAGLAFVARPEAALVLPLFAVLARSRKSMLALALFAIVAAMVTALRYAAFGEVLPNTALAKPTSVGVWLVNLHGLVAGKPAYLPMPLLGLPAIALAAIGWHRLRRADAAIADMLAAQSLVGLAFIIYAPPDWTDLARYFAPYAPGALTLAWNGVLTLVDRGGTGRAASLGVHVLALVLIAAATLDGVAKQSLAGKFPGYVIFGRTLAEPARELGRRLPPEAVIATRRIGAVAYWSNRSVFDYAVGIVDREIAQLQRGLERGFENPDDPRLSAVWRARRPTHLLEDDDVIDRLARRLGGNAEGFALQGERFRVVARYAIGSHAEWTLAEREAR